MLIARVMLITIAITLTGGTMPATDCHAQIDGTTNQAESQETATADKANGGETHRRWALGWDGGIGMRYRFAGPWGFGISFDPHWRDRGGNEEWYSEPYWEENPEIALGEGISKSKALALSGFMFREVRIGRWVGVGPFFGGGYSYSNNTQESTRRSTQNTQQGQLVETSLRQEGFEDRSWYLFAGIRPTFTFDDRFVLETRFGLIFSYSRRERSYVSRETVYSPGEIQTGGYATRDVDDGWSVDVFGRDLGPGSIMSFMVYF